MKKEPMFFLDYHLLVSFPNTRHGFFSNFTLKISFLHLFKKIGVFHDLGEGKFQIENYVYK